jgi:hypothetical protein
MRFSIMKICGLFVHKDNIFCAIGNCLFLPNNEKALLSGIWNMLNFLSQQPIVP